MKFKFEKWQGLGNDFIIAEDIKLTPELAKTLCDRNFGIGADGIFCPVKIEDENEADIAWDFLNSDGSIAQMCGNGIRCFAKYVFEHGLIKKNKFKIKTLAGIIIPELLEDGNVRVDMGMPVFEAKKIPVNVVNPLDFEVEGFKATAVSMGNPHCVIFIKNNGNGNDSGNDINDGASHALQFGHSIEVAHIFPEKTNVEFVEILSKNKIKVDVFERGCGITMACGTGACASVVAGIKKGFLDNKVEVVLKGGSLFIEYYGENVLMTGSAVKVFEGEIQINI